MSTGKAPSSDDDDDNSPVRAAASILASAAAIDGKQQDNGVEASNDGKTQSSLKSQPVTSGPESVTETITHERR